MCKTCDEKRWEGIVRPYAKDAVEDLRGSRYFSQDFAIARNGAKVLWHLLHTRPFVRTLGAQTGMQAVQMAKAKLEAVYCSGWQTAADMNAAGETFPDQHYLWLKQELHCLLLAVWYYLPCQLP